MRAAWRRFKRGVKPTLAGIFIIVAVSGIAWAVRRDLNAPQASLHENTVYYGLSTIAQSAAALAAILGTFGLWRLDRLRERDRQDEDREAQLRKELLALRVRREHEQEKTGVEQPPTSMEETVETLLMSTGVFRQLSMDEWRSHKNRLVALKCPRIMSTDVDV